MTVKANRVKCEKCTTHKKYFILKYLKYIRHKVVTAHSSKTFFIQLENIIFLYKDL